MFVVERQSLLSALATVQSLAGNSASVAALVAEEDNNLVVAAGGTDRGARCSTMASRKLLAGTVAVPLKPLIRLLGHSAGSKVEVAFNGKSVAVAVDADGPCPRRYTFADPEADDVPDRPPADANAVTVELASASFVALIERTGFCTTKKPAASRWATDGVELRVADGRVTASATDCFRLATASAPAKKTARFLVADGVLRSWLKVIKNTESIRLSLGEKLIIRAGSFVAWVAPHEGTFPDLGSLPTELPNSLTVPSEPFRAAVESALALVDTGEPQIHITTKRGALVVSSSAGGAKCESTVPVPGCSGPALAIDVDGYRLLGTLRAYADAPTVTLEYASGDQPIALIASDCRTLLVPHREREERAAKRAKQTA